MPSQVLAPRKDPITLLKPPALEHLAPADPDGNDGISVRRELDERAALVAVQRWTGYVIGALPGAIVWDKRP